MAALRRLQLLVSNLRRAALCRRRARLEAKLHRRDWIRDSAEHHYLEVDPQRTQLVHRIERIEAMLRSLEPNRDHLIKKR